MGHSPWGIPLFLFLAHSGKAAQIHTILSSTPMLPWAEGQKRVCGSALLCRAVLQCSRHTVVQHPASSSPRVADIAEAIQLRRRLRTGAIQLDLCDQRPRSDLAAARSDVARLFGLEHACRECGAGGGASERGDADRAPWDERERAGRPDGA